MNNASAATCLAKCCVLSRKQDSYPMVPLSDEPFTHVQLVHAPLALNA